MMTNKIQSTSLSTLVVAGLVFNFVLVPLIEATFFSCAHSVYQLPQLITAVLSTRSCTLIATTQFVVALIPMRPCCNSSNLQPLRNPVLFLDWGNHQVQFVPRNCTHTSHTFSCTQPFTKSYLLLYTSRHNTENRRKKATTANFFYICQLMYSDYNAHTIQSKGCSLLVEGSYSCHSRYFSYCTNASLQS